MNSRHIPQDIAEQKNDAGCFPLNYREEVSLHCVEPDGCAIHIWIIGEEDEAAASFGFITWAGLRDLQKGIAPK